MVSLLPFLPLHIGVKGIYDSSSTFLDGFTFYSLILITFQDAYILGTFTLLTLGNTTWIDHLKTGSYSSKTKPKRTFQEWVQFIFGQDHFSLSCLLPWVDNRNMTEANDRETKILNE